MCLKTVDAPSRRVIPYNRAGVGWKAVRREGSKPGDKYRFLTVRSMYRASPLPVNAWVADLSHPAVITVEGSDGDGPRKEYPAGFHVWLEKPELTPVAASTGLQVMPVAFRHVVAQGTDSILVERGGVPELKLAPTVVAREIYVIGRENFEPLKEAGVLNLPLDMRSVWRQETVLVARESRLMKMEPV